MSIGKQSNIFNTIDAHARIRLLLKMNWGQRVSITVAAYVPPLRLLPFPISGFYLYQFIFYGPLKNPNCLIVTRISDYNYYNLRFVTSKTAWSEMLKVVK